MSDPSPATGVIEWHPSICPRARWLRIVIQLHRMQQDIRDAQRHTTGTMHNI